VNYSKDCLMYACLSLVVYAYTIHYCISVPC